MFSLIKDTLSRLFLLSLDAMRKTTITTPSTNKTNLNNQHDWKAQKVAMLQRTHYKRIPFSFMDFFSNSNQIPKALLQHEWWRGTALLCLFASKLFPLQWSVLRLISTQLFTACLTPKQLYLSIYRCWVLPEPESMMPLLGNRHRETTIWNLAHTKKKKLNKAFELLPHVVLQLALQGILWGEWNIDAPR